MKFSEVVIKNFFGNIRRYMSFFSCNIFSIALFFVYATIAFNDVINEKGNEWMSMIIPVSIVGISVFSIFFIVYAHTSFVKGRNKEFGVYLTLGMSRKELKKLVNMENLIIEGISIAAGLILGTILSRVFQMVILKILDLDGVEYQLDYRSYLVTLAGFIAIFLIVFLITNRKMSKMDISSLLVESRKSEGKKSGKNDVLFGFIGCLFIVASIVLLMLIASDEELNSNSMIVLIYTLLMFSGVYLVVSRGGNMVIHLLHKSKSYYKNMLSIAEIHYKYNQNKKILFTLSVLSAMSIFLIASPFSLFNLTETIIDDKINDIEYVSTSTVNNFDNTEIITNDDLLKDEKIEFVFLNKISGSTKLQDSIPIVPQSLYNERSGASLTLNNGECAVTIIDWTPGNHGFEAGSILTLYNSANKPYEYKLVKAGHNEVITDQSFCSDSMVILSDRDYENLKSSVTSENIGTYHFINYKKWKSTDSIVNALGEKIGESPLPLLSKVSAFKELKAGYSSFLFVASVLGLLFFIAGGIVLYFRQYVELPDAKVLFGKLNKIGITRKEVVRIVSMELKVIFFVPLIFGIFIGVSYIYLISNMVNGASVLDEFMKNTFYVVIMYIILQSLFYLLTRIKYVSQLER